VTGGSRGIGRAIAEALLAEGASIAICGRSAEKGKAALDEMSAGDRGHFVACDVRRHDEVEGFIDDTAGHFGALDMLVNNAGGTDGFARVHELSDQAWNDALAWNLNSTFWATRRALPYMLAQQWGRIIAISSVEGKQATKPAVSHYTIDIMVTLTLGSLAPPVIGMRGQDTLKSQLGWQAPRSEPRSPRGARQPALLYPARFHDLLSDLPLSADPAQLVTVAGDDERHRAVVTDIGLVRGVVRHRARLIRAGEVDVVDGELVMLPGLPGGHPVDPPDDLVCPGQVGHRHVRPVRVIGEQRAQRGEVLLVDAGGIPVENVTDLLPVDQPAQFLGSDRCVGCGGVHGSAPQPSVTVMAPAGQACAPAVAAASSPAGTSRVRLWPAQKPSSSGSKTSGLTV
jgi:hypothetical protein